MHNLYRKSLRLIAVVAVTLTLASMFIIPCVARIFVGYDAELLALTSRAFRLYALSFLIMGFNIFITPFPVASCKPLRTPPFPTKPASIDIVPCEVTFTK